MIKIIKQEITYKSIEKDFTINAFGMTFSGRKWFSYSGDGDYDGDWEFDRESLKLFESLSEYKKDVISDFVNEKIKL